MHILLRALTALGYQKLTLQIGRGSVQPSPDGCPGIALHVFRYKDSIADDIRDADLVISHAGAGSCLETLGAGRPLLVVVNDQLMNNHQLELARALHSQGHLHYCTCSNLTETLRTVDLSALVPFLPGQPQTFAVFLDRAVGLQ
ncbi:UDP-N-acetylglucosamine transferase subunit ALG13-like isoform X2 [Amia ocellicauda]|uniref:UDP-N-acetylglucosamine transferase subunit ALG13 isoform X2 n=1 Tax=Amia ocellicauda TaxID=2972642 RepID=UPI003464E764